MARNYVTAPHPYFPEDLHIPGYTPNTSSLSELATRFVSILAITIITAVWLAKRFTPNLTLGETFTLAWFVLCKCLGCSNSPQLSCAIQY